MKFSYLGSSIAVIIGCAILFGPIEASSQDLGSIDIASPTGVRVSSDFYDQSLTVSETQKSLATFLYAARIAPGPPFRFSIVPALARADGATLFGLTAGLFTFVSGDRLTQFSGGFRRTLLDEAGGSDTFTGGARLTVVSASDQLLHKQLPTTAQIVGEISRIRDTATKFGITLAADQEIWKQKNGHRAIKVGGNVGYATSNPDGTAALRDLLLAAGVTYVVDGRTYFSADYRLKDDVIGEDDYSLTFNQVISGSGFPGIARLSLSVRKHKVVSLGIVSVFK